MRGGAAKGREAAKGGGDVERERREGKEDKNTVYRKRGCLVQRRFG